MNVKQNLKSGNDIEATASVNTDSDGGVLGVALFLGESDLERLGVADADSVGYSVKDGFLKLEGIEDGK